MRVNGSKNGRLPQPSVGDIIAVLLLLFTDLASGRRATIFGATSGVGQLIAKQALAKTWDINAVSRDITSAAAFDNLAGSNFVQADTRDAASLSQPTLFKDVDSVVISVGTTAFPTSKWEDGKNNPRIACLESVENILNAIGAVQRRPKRVFLISSIGVERSNQFPFLILNWHKVLEYKRQSEQLLIERSKDLGFEAVVVRPGRLVGAPFTNFDLARLLQLDQGANKGVTVSSQDDVAGDMERRDVARAVLSLMEAPTVKAPKVFSIVNAPGEGPSDEQLAALLSTV